MLNAGARSAVQAKLGLQPQGMLGNFCCAHYMCSCCAMAQELHALKVAGIIPGYASPAPVAEMTRKA